LFSLNFFGEYHGKSVVDGHFGVLSHWFNEGERVRYITSISDLICWLRGKARSGLCGIDVFFDIYLRQQRPRFIHKLVIQDFCSCSSFVRTEHILYVSSLSTMKPVDYRQVNFIVKVCKDNRNTKYAPARIGGKPEVPVVMGSRSQQILLTRMRFISDLPQLMELSEHSFDGDAMEITEV
jgi:hypothetical protein